MPLNILALDQASVTGFCSNQQRAQGKEDWRYETGVFKMPKRDEIGERLMLFRRGLVKCIEKFQPELIAFETPHFPFHDGGPTTIADTFKARTPSFLPEGNPAEPLRAGRFNVETIKHLQMIRGVLTCTASEHGIPLESYPPASWRKTALGFGMAPRGSDMTFMKRAMMNKAKQLGYPGLSEDECEALGIMLHAESGPPANERAQGDLMLLAKGRLK